MSLPARAHARNVLRAYRTSSDAELLTLALETFEGGERNLAYELLRAAPRALAAAKPAHVKRLATHLHTWSEVDCFACFVAGVAWRLNRISDQEILRLAASTNRWLRRAALVATVPLNARSRGASAATGDAPRTLGVCIRLLHDRDPMVVKAMSWALRELVKRNPGEVRAFLAEHGLRIAALIRREVNNKLASGRKSARAAAQ